MIAVREFTTAAEVFANAKAMRAKFFSVKPGKRDEDGRPVKVEDKPRDVGAWEREPLMFDSHVIAYRMAMRIQAMIDAGEIEMVQINARKPVLEIVREVLADFPWFTVEDLKSARRPIDLCHVRMIAIYEVRKQRPDMSFPAIGRWFGDRDHTTILHSVKKMETILGKRAEYQQEESDKGRKITAQQRAMASKMWKEGLSSSEIAAVIHVDAKRIIQIACRDRENFPFRGKGFNNNAKGRAA